MKTILYTTFKKSLLISLLLLLYVHSFSQYKIPEYTKLQNRENWIRFGLFTSSIVFDALGDAYNNQNKKDIGHFLNSLSILSLLTIPILTETERKDWLPFLSTYCCLRFSIFNLTYNLASGNEPFYISKSGTIDKLCLKLPEEVVNGARLVSFMVGITINFEKL